MNNNTLAIALAALLVGGVAVAAFNNNRDGAGPGGLEYATVLDVQPITEKQELFAQVIDTKPVRETSTTSTPREVCNDVVVAERLPERDGNVGGQVVNSTQRECHTTTSTSQTSKVVAYKVTYRNPDGTTGTMRTDEDPGQTVALGVEDVPVAYDVTYEYDGQERTVRLPERPLDGRLPVVDGQVVAQVDAQADATAGTERQ